MIMLERLDAGTCTTYCTWYVALCAVGTSLSDSVVPLGQKTVLPPTFLFNRSANSLRGSYRSPLKASDH